MISTTLDILIVDVSMVLIGNLVAGKPSLTSTRRLAAAVLVALDLYTAWRVAQSTGWL